MNNTTIFGGGSILLLTVLTWAIVPFPANLIIVGILTLVSIVAYFLLQTFTTNYRLHEVVPAATLDIGILVFLLSFLDTASALMIWFGLNFIVTGYILRDYVQNRPSWQERFGRFQYAIGGVLIVAGIFWTVTWGTLSYTNHDDDVVRWFETTASQMTQEEDWYLVLTDNESVSYLASVDYLTHSKMEFSAVWIDNNEYGETIGELKQSGYKNRYSRYSGEITIRPAGSIPLQHGTAQLEEVGEECFIGNMEFPGIEYEAKLHKKGVRCG